MDEKFKVRYQAGDGYVGKDRPLYFKIGSDEIEDDMGDDDFISLYETAIQDDFESRVTPEGENLDEFIEWARQVRDSR